MTSVVCSTLSPRATFRSKGWVLSASTQNSIVHGADPR
jgi:hypothetical protein